MNATGLVARSCANAASRCSSLCSQNSGEDRSVVTTDMRGRLRARLHAVAAEAVHPIRRPEYRLGDVAHVHAARRHALLAAAVGVAVQREVRTGLVDGLGQVVRAEEGEDLEPLALE